MNLYFLIAKRFLFPKKKFTSSIINFISFLGLFIGATSIVLSISVLNGFQDILKSEYTKLYGQFLIEDYDDQADKSIKNYLDLNNSSYSINSVDELLIIAQNKQSLIELKSVTNQSIIDFYDLNLKENHEILSGNEIIIGNSLASRLNLDIGDKVQIISKDFKFNSFGIPEIKEVVVVNVFTNRILKADDSLIFGIINESKNKNLSFEFNNSEVLTSNLSSKILSWKDRNQQLFEATEIEKKITFFTLSLIILVASFNLSSSIMQITSKKLKDLAVLMSLGMNKSGIKIIFIIYSYLIGAGAILLGISFAVLIIFIQNTHSLINLNPEFYLVDTLPMNIFIGDILFLLAGSLVLVGIFSLIPLRFVKNMSPNQIINRQI
ncbi:MAG: ABC transporter permease [Candidatus Neomarinimicrobiota bacterium]|tara:strand:- start:1852 stop:2988 length:1137 start_codon:yes stop_codon:yes gene_type:complete